MCVILEVTDFRIYRDYGSTPYGKYYSYVKNPQQQVLF